MGTQIQDRAKVVTDAVAKKDFKTAGDGAAWISFLGLPHVYPGESETDTKLWTLFNHLLQ